MTGGIIGADMSGLAGTPFDGALGAFSFGAANNGQGTRAGSSDFPVAAFTFSGAIVIEVPEVCDGIDNDCDGIIDEEANCGAEGDSCTVNADCATGNCDAGLRRQPLRQHAQRRRDRRDCGLLRSVRHWRPARGPRLLLRRLPGQRLRDYATPARRPRHHRALRKPGRRRVRPRAPSSTTAAHRPTISPAAPSRPSTTSPSPRAHSSGPGTRC